MLVGLLEGRRTHTSIVGLLSVCRHDQGKIGWLAGWLVGWETTLSKADFLGVQMDL